MDAYLTAVENAHRDGGDGVETAVAKELNDLARELQEACESIGFFYLTGFERVLPREVCTKALAAARCDASQSVILIHTLRHDSLRARG